MINCAIIMGRLTADPELRTTSNGNSVTTFCVAVDRSYTRPGEEKQADFINVTAWRQTANFVTRYFRKGSMIAVQGSIQTRSYEDKNGNKRTNVEIVADNVSFCGSRTNDGNAQNTFEAPVQNTPSYKSENTEAFSEISAPEQDDYTFSADPDSTETLPF